MAAQQVPLLANPVAQILGDARRLGKVYGMTLPETSETFPDLVLTLVYLSPSPN